jgi:hypothetical protein
MIAHYRVFQSKERKTLLEELEEMLNEHAEDGWTFSQVDASFSLRTGSLDPILNPIT